jgi:hypothetical protein
LNFRNRFSKIAFISYWLGPQFEKAYLPPRLRDKPGMENSPGTICPRKKLRLNVPPPKCE